MKVRNPLYQCQALGNKVMNMRFYRRWGISWLAGPLSASQERFCSIILKRKAKGKKREKKGDEKKYT
jgi:hypothetical protein